MSQILSNVKLLQTNDKIVSLYRIGPSRPGLSSRLNNFERHRLWTRTAILLNWFCVEFVHMVNLISALLKYLKLALNSKSKLFCNFLSNKSLNL